MRPDKRTMNRWLYPYCRREAKQTVRPFFTRRAGQPDSTYGTSRLQVCRPVPWVEVRDRRDDPGAYERGVPLEGRPHLLFEPDRVSGRSISAFAVVARSLAEVRESCRVLP